MCSYQWLYIGLVTYKNRNTAGFGSRSSTFPYIYINDLDDVTSHSDVFLFADDTNITSRSSSIEIFQNDLTNVANWLCANKLTINTDKTTVISFNKNRSASNIDIKLLETVYKPEPSCKYLGVVLDSKLSFFHHIQKLKQNWVGTAVLFLRCVIMFKSPFY